MTDNNSCITVGDTGFSFLWICAMFYTAYKIGAIEFFSRFEGSFWNDLWEMFKFSWFWWWELFNL